MSSDDETGVACFYCTGRHEATLLTLRSPASDWNGGDRSGTFGARWVELISKRKRGNEFPNWGVQFPNETSFEDKEEKNLPQESWGRLWIHFSTETDFEMRRIFTPVTPSDVSSHSRGPGGVTPWSYPLQRRKESFVKHAQWRPSSRKGNWMNFSWTLNVPVNRWMSMSVLGPNELISQGQQQGITTVS